MVDALRVASSSRERMADAVAWANATSHDDALAALLGRSAAPTSRQARHARSFRTRCTAAAASFALAADDMAFGELFFQPDFAALRPYSASVHTRLAELVVAGRALSAPDYAPFWDGAVQRIFDLGSRRRDLDRGELLVLYTALGVLLGIGVMFGPALAEPWRRVFRDARGSRVFDNPYARLQLARAGAYVDCDGPCVDLLMEPAGQAIEHTNIYAFVRLDLEDDLLDHIARMTSGVRTDVAAALEARHAQPTLNAVIGYCRMTLRHPAVFRNAGTALMALSWISDAASRIPALVSAGALDDDLATLASGLRKFEVVQTLENARFWRIVDAITREPVRTRLIELWQRDYQRAAHEDPPA